MNTPEQYEKFMITSMVAGIEPVVVSRAKECTFYAEDGRQYLDCFSGISVTNAGHGHPRILAAVKQQLEELVHCCTYIYYNPRAAELAQALAAMTPGRLQKSFFGNSGAEAIEGAMRLAKQHTGRQELVALTHSFHGRTAATLSVTGNRSRKKGSGPYLPGVSFAPAPYCYRCPFKLSYPSCDIACAQHMEEVLKYQASNPVAAFLAEPVLGEGGIIVPPAEYFEIAVGLVRDDGGLFIADEVQSGFGRTGKLFAIEHYGVEPDIMAMAKGIAGGFPLGAFIAREDVADAFTPGDHLSTFGGNPVSCAAGIANLQVMQDESLPERSAQLGDHLLRRLTQLCQDGQALIGDVRGKGLMVGVELVLDADKTPATEVARQVQQRCRDNGVLVGVGGSLGNVMRLQPPLVITQAQADHAVDVLEAAIAEVATHLHARAVRQADSSD